MRLLSILWLGFFATTVAGCSESTSPTSPKNIEPESVVERGLLETANPGDIVKPAAVDSDFVGSAACRACHETICDQFANHPMGKSVSTDVAVFAETDASATFTTSAGLAYDIERKEQEVIHHERLPDEDGKTVYDRAEQIQFAIGSGKRGRSYCFVKSGRIYMSPVTWYSRQQKWDLSPGYRPDNHPGFERKASDGCMACHAGRMDPVPNNRAQFQNATFLEPAIGCERCHGPGGRHVDFHTTKTGSDKIVNPINLSHAQRDAVCFQCHLQGERRVVRYGRSEYDFRPGMNVNDIWVTFVKDGSIEGGKAEAVSQVEQMLKSKCYQSSKGNLGCASCHDPHQIPAEENRVEFYRGRCQQCHESGKGSDCALPADDAQRKAAADSCIQCHMPALAATDVPHTAQTDHSVPRIPRDMSQAFADTNRRELPETIFEEPGFEIPEYERLRAKIILLAETASGKQDKELASVALKLIHEIVPVAQDDADLFEAAGLVFESLRQPDLADEHWNKALEIRPGDEALLELLATMYHSKGDARKARDYYARLVQANDSRPTYFGRFAHALGQSGQLPQGILAAKKALDLNPGLPQAHAWLGEAYEVMGNTTEARYHREKAEEQIRIRSRQSGGSVPE